MHQIERNSAALPFVLCVAAVLLAGCATQPTPPSDYDAPGFLAGLFHGFLIVFSFIFSLITDDYRIYAYPNDGGWYDFGFLIGVIVFFGGAANSAD